MQNPVLDALTELVAVYDDGIEPSERAYDVWQERWGKAWEAARAALALQAPTRENWRALIIAHGGHFHGPHVEHISMCERGFLKMMASLYAEPPAPRERSIVQTIDERLGAGWTGRLADALTKADGTHAAADSDHEAGK